MHVKCIKFLFAFESDILSHMQQMVQQTEYGYWDEARPPVGGHQYPCGKRKEEN